MRLVEGTDRGAAATAEEKTAIAAAIRDLTAATQASRANATGAGSETITADATSYLENELIFGNYNVVYTASGNAQYGEPAGGRFRGALGRRLFKTISVRQALYEPNVVVNEVAFMLLGFLRGRVSLTGTFAPWEGDSRNAGDGDAVDELDTRNTVRADFLQPELELGKLRLRIGPTSTVVLCTTYLDEEIRLGVGGRGSLFVFRRIDNARQAPPRDETPSGSEIGTTIRSRWAAMSCVVAAAGVVVTKGLSSASASSAMAIAISTAALVALLLPAALVLRNGGIIGSGARAEKKGEGP